MSDQTSDNASYQLLVYSVWSVGVLSLFGASKHSSVSDTFTEDTKAHHRIEFHWKAPYYVMVQVPCNAKGSLDDARPMKNAVVFKNLWSSTGAGLM